MQNPACGKEEILVRIHARAEQLGISSVVKALGVLIGSKLDCQQCLKVYQQDHGQLSEGRDYSQFWVPQHEKDTDKLELV